MNFQTKGCDPQQIEAFLDERLNESQQAALVEHLNLCLPCREQIGRLAAEPETWAAADNFLTDEAFDSILLGTSEYLRESRQLRTLHGGSADSIEAAIGHSSTLRIDTLLSMLSPTDDPRMLGRLGGYEISGAIGAGGMGIVLKGHDLALARIVAIKVLMPHLATSGAARQRFAREAKAAAAVLHPNVIAIHSVSSAAELPYLVMPYVRGRSLQKRLDDHGPMELKEALRVGCQVAAGLAAAHAQGLVHRDIKPANILLEDGVERVTITDFGLARAVDDATLTRSGVIAGTPLYMSPEQAGGEPIDARSDLFSLASVLYTMCAGRPPFRAETSLGVLRRITDDTPRPLCVVNPEIPEWMSRLVDRLHAKRPEDRFQSAAEVEQLLQQCLAHLEQPKRTPLPDCLILPLHRPWKTAIVVGSLILLLATVVGLLVFTSQWGDLHPSQSNSANAHTDANETSSSAAIVETASPQGVESTWDDGISESLSEIAAAIGTLEDSIDTP